MAERVETNGDPGDAPDAPEPPRYQPGDYYATLGVSASADLAAIKRAFHREAKRWHPDRYVGAAPDVYERAERHMRQVTEAYHVLSDPAARATYDASLRGDEQPTGPGGVSSSIVGGYRSEVTHDWSGGEHASSNPNGAGMFFAALAAVVGLALLAGVAGGGASGNVPVLIGLFALLAILIIVAALFMTDSTASRWATNVMEGEPRGFTPRTSRRTQRPAGDNANVTYTTAAASESEDDDTRFARLVREAINSVPDEFRPYMGNIAVEVEQEPSEETLRQSGVPEGYTLLGLYRGVPLGKRGVAETAPDIITIYRGPIERHSGPDPDAIREQVRATTLHELAHHFGMDHDEMPEWVK